MDELEIADPDCELLSLGIVLTGQVLTGQLTVGVVKFAPRILQDISKELLHECTPDRYAASFRVAD